MKFPAVNFLSVGLCTLALSVSFCGKKDEPKTTLNRYNSAKLIFSEPFAYDFGLVVVGTSSKVTLTMTNTGAVAATEIHSEFATSAFQYENGFPGDQGNCGSELEGGQSCEIVVHFTPQLVVEYVEILRVNYNNGVETVTTKKPLLEGRGRAE